MEKEIHRLFWLVILIFILLTVGEFFLYKKIMGVNKMFSEGLMQLKESGRIKLTVTPKMMKVLNK